jgi:hypothetical protein
MPNESAHERRVRTLARRKGCRLWKARGSRALVGVRGRTRWAWFAKGAGQSG